MHEMMQQFATNPELMNLLITSNPLLADDPSLANQIRGTPYFYQFLTTDKVR